MSSNEKSSAAGTHEPKYGGYGSGYNAQGVPVSALAVFRARLDRESRNQSNEWCGTFPVLLAAILAVAHQRKVAFGAVDALANDGSVRGSSHERRSLGRDWRELRWSSVAVSRTALLAYSLSVPTSALAAFARYLKL